MPTKTARLLIDIFEDVGRGTAKLERCFGSHWLDIGGTTYAVCAEYLFWRTHLNYQYNYQLAPSETRRLISRVRRYGPDINVGRGDGDNRNPWRNVHFNMHRALRVAQSADIYVGLDIFRVQHIEQVGIAADFYRHLPRIDAKNALFGGTFQDCYGPGNVALLDAC